MKKHFLRFSIAIFAFICLTISAQAQKGTYAITDANVVLASGSTLSSATVVVRDGLIESVGKNAKVPSDATVLDGKGLTIYPGFIDTYTNLGIKKSSSRSQGQSGNQDKSNSNYNEVLRAETKAVDGLKAGESQFKTQRDNGFTTVLTVGKDGIFQGNSAVINLAGDSVSEMLVHPMFGQHVTFTTASGGVFPSSLMGTFAALRQMFYDAKRLDDIQKAYAKNPRGMKRPEADSTLEALIPVVNGEMPIVFNADSEREMIRVLDLIKEYKLKGMIAGGRESYKVVDRLKAQNVPVFLSLNFPVRILSENKELDPEPLSVLRMRVEVPKNAAKLKEAGVKFAFQSGGMKNLKDFVKNAEIATENGLAKSDAIRAMTLNAAELLGIDKQLGSIEAGKIANLVVMEGDIFDDDKKITHIFIDGKMFEQPKKPKRKAGDKSADTGKPLQLEGTWAITIEAPGQTIPATINFSQSGSTLTGTLDSPLFGSAPIRSGLATSKGFTFDVTISVGQDLDVSFTGIVTGAKVEGTADTDQGPAAFSGTKKP